MTFVKLIKIIDILKSGKVIIVKKDLYDGLTDDEEFEKVDSLSIYDDVSDIMKYIMDSKYHFFIEKDDGWYDEEIEDD